MVGVDHLALTGLVPGRCYRVRIDTVADRLGNRSEAGASGAVWVAGP